MVDQEDVMLTIRQKIQLNNDEHNFFRREVESWREEIQNQQDTPNCLEDISYIESSEDEENGDVTGSEFLKKGKMFLEKGEWARAISMYTSAISKKRTARSYTGRALAYLKRCSFAEAEKDCTEAINLDPKFTKAFIRRALARKLLGKCKESCDDMEIIMKLEPNNEIVALEYEAMLDYLQKNLTCNDDCHTQHDIIQETAMKLKQLGNDLVSKSQYRKAIVKFTSAIKLNPRDPTFYANRAICYMKQKDFVSAEKDCTDALKLDGKYAKVYLRRARVRKCLGKLYESRQDFYSTFELTHDEKVLDELDAVNKSIIQIETQKRNNGEDIENCDVFSILEKDNLGQPKFLELASIEQKNEHDKDTKRMNDAPNIDSLTLNVSEKECSEMTKDISKQSPSSTSKTSIQQNTTISFPALASTDLDVFSAKYDIRETFPLKRDDPSVKFTGPFIRVSIKDGQFAAPDKLLEIPDDLMRNLSPR